MPFPGNLVYTYIPMKNCQGPYEAYSNRHQPLGTRYIKNDVLSPGAAIIMGTAQKIYLVEVEYNTRIRFLYVTMVTGLDVTDIKAHV